jgi:hypothetical protein
VAMCGTPNRGASRRAWVPLPAPGGPSRTMRSARSAPPVPRRCVSRLHRSSREPAEPGISGPFARPCRSACRVQGGRRPTRRPGSAERHGSGGLMVSHRRACDPISRWYAWNAATQAGCWERRSWSSTTVRRASPAHLWAPTSARSSAGPPGAARVGTQLASAWNSDRAGRSEATRPACQRSARPPAPSTISPVGDQAPGRPRHSVPACRLTPRRG